MKNIYIFFILTLQLNVSIAQEKKTISLETDDSIEKRGVVVIDTTINIIIRVNQADYNSIKQNMGLKHELVDSRSYFEILTDQDVLDKKRNQDRDYTMGVQFNWYATNLTRSSNLLISPFLINWIDNYTLKPFKSRITKKDLALRSMGFGFSGFTPEALEQEDIVFSDRPYASIFTVNASNYYLKQVDPVNILGITLKKYNTFSSAFYWGMLGDMPSRISQFVQTGIHSGQRAFDPNARPDPKGWHHSIGAGGNRPVFNYDMRYGQRFIYNPALDSLILLLGTDGEMSNFKISAEYYAGLSCGLVYNNVNAGVSGEVGFFDPNSLWSEIGTSPPQHKLNKSGEKDLSRWKISASVVGNIQSYYWFHNSMLQGLNWYFDSPHTLGYSQINKVGLLAQWGFKVRINKTVIVFLKTVRSSSHKLNNFNQGYGRVIVRFDI